MENNNKNAICSKTYNNERVIKEIKEVIEESVGVTDFKIIKSVKVDEIVTLKIEVELIHNENGKKIIV